MDINALARAHIRLRDARASLRRDYETQDDELKQKQNVIEAQMLKLMLDSNVSSVRTDSGTFYKQEQMIPIGSDWEVFYNWIAKNQAFDALERRVKRTFVQEYMEEHNGEPPPGISVLRENVVRVRRT